LPAASPPENGSAPSVVPPWKVQKPPDAAAPTSTPKAKPPPQVNTPPPPNNSMSKSAPMAPWRASSVPQGGSTRSLAESMADIAAGKGMQKGDGGMRSPPAKGLPMGNSKAAPPWATSMSSSPSGGKGQQGADSWASGPGGKGFMKGGMPPPQTSAAQDILRRGEEILRQTQLFQEQSRKQEEDQKKQEEMERRKAQLEQYRKEQAEKQAIKDEEIRKLREEADNEARTLQEELAKLVEVAEAEVKNAEAAASALDPAGLTTEELITIADEFEVAGSGATSAVKGCFDFMEGKHIKLKGTAEDTMSACAALLKRIHGSKATCDKTKTKVLMRVKPARDEVAAKTLQVELESLLLAAETQAETMKEMQVAVDSAAQSATTEAKSGPEAGGGAADQELIRVSTEFENVGMAAVQAVARCTTLMDSNVTRIRGTSEETKSTATKLTGRGRLLRATVDESLNKVKTLKSNAQQRVDREARKLAAKKEAEKQVGIFKQYDKDSDELLNEEEIKAYVTAEYGFTIAEEKLKLILSSSPNGVPLAEFARLRSQIGVAYSEFLAKQRKERSAQQSVLIKKDTSEAQSALSGVESEVAKAEGVVRLIGPLMPRAVQFLEMLTERTEEAEAAVDAARDFLAAAKEQAQLLGRGNTQELETEAKQLALTEAAKLSRAVVALDARLTAASNVAKAARAKIDFLEKKAALMREAMAM